MSHKLFAAISFVVLVSLVLTACQPQTIYQTVEVTKEVVKQVQVEVTKQVEVVKQVEATKLVEVQRKAFTTPHPILSNLKVRQAIAYCTNKPELIASVYPLISKEEQAKLVMDTFIPKAHWAYAGDQNVTIYPFDPAKGKQLLDEAGWKLEKDADFRTNDKKEELSLKFTTTSAAFRQTWAAVFEQQMKDCGISIIRLHAPSTWWFGDTTGLARRDYELGAFAWVGQADPGGQTLYACDQIQFPENNWEGQNGMGWCNEAASKNIKLANNTLIKQERINAYKIVQQEFAKDMVSLPLFNRTETFAFNANLKGFTPTPGEEYYNYNAAEWEIPGRDTIVIGFTQEPASLFGLVEDAWVAHLALELINGLYYTSLNYDFQPLIQKQLSTLESGLAKNNDVEVKEGDKVYDAGGNPVVLKAGVKVKDTAGNDVEFKSGTVKMKQLVVKYEFLDGLKWSDGTPVSQADYELSYKINCDKESGATSFITCDKTQKIEFAPNGYTVTFLPGVQDPLYFNAAFLSSGRTDGFFQANRKLSDGRLLKDVPAKEWATLPEIAEKPTGVGPYVLTQWVKGSKIVFEANPNYFKGAPKTKKLVISFITPENAEAQLLAGQVDLLGSETLSGITETLDKAAKAGKIKIAVIAGGTWEHIDMNLFVR